MRVSTYILFCIRHGGELFVHFVETDIIVTEKEGTYDICASLTKEINLASNNIIEINTSLNFSLILLVQVW